MNFQNFISLVIENWKLVIGVWILVVLDIEIDIEFELTFENLFFTLGYTKDKPLLFCLKYNPWNKKHTC